MPRDNNNIDTIDVCVYGVVKYVWFVLGCVFIICKGYSACTERL